MILFGNSVKKRGTSIENIPIGDIKAPGIPWIGDIAATVGIIQQLVYLSVRITAQYTKHIPDVGAVHADEQIVPGIVAALQLHRPLPVAGKSVPGKLGFGGRIHRVANAVPNLLCA